MCETENFIRLAHDRRVENLVFFFFKIQTSFKSPITAILRYLTGINLTCFQFSRLRHVATLNVAGTNLDYFFPHPNCQFLLVAWCQSRVSLQRMATRNSQDTRYSPCILKCVLLNIISTECLNTSLRTHYGNHVTQTKACDQQFTLNAVL